MAGTNGFETTLDAYREQVNRPLWRLFRCYAPGKGAWLAVGLITSILAYGTVLVTPIVLGTTIDAVFTNHKCTRTWIIQAGCSQRRCAGYTSLRDGCRRGNK